MALNTDIQYRQVSSGLHHRSIAGITVLHHQSWEQPMVLNEAMHMVWTCLAFGGSVNDIAADIVDVFGQSADGVRDDVMEAFRQLHDLSLIEPAS